MQQKNSQINKIRSRKTTINSPQGQLHDPVLTNDRGFSVMKKNKYKYVKIWRKNNPEKDKLHKKNYSIKHRKELNEKIKKWQHKNRDKTNKYFIEWGKKNPEKLEQKKLRAKAKVLGISITYSQYKDLCNKQNNLCAICGRPEKTKHIKTKSVYILSIDHCHKTKKVRGLLCKKCNTAIGFFEDNIDTLKKAINYLKKHI